MQDFILHETNKAQLWSLLKEILSTGKRWRIKISEYRERRSLPQNSLLWKWNSEIAEQLTAVSSDSFSDEEVHEWLKDMYCPAKPVTISGMTRYVKSTRRLDIGEMHKYLTDIDQWAHQKGLRLTIPDSCEYRELQRRQDA
ncbi:YbcN family protein [Klebsiella quasipneumoniae]|nr:YbcN family protein [Klebsiella quasipneumoniae]